MSDGRPPSFQFYPRDFLADVAGILSHGQVGAYILAMCRSWLTATPGVATEDGWRRMMGYLPGEWESVRADFLPFFKVGRDGSWTQRRMVMEREAQRRRHENARKGADATNLRRWGSVANDVARESLAVSPASASASASALESTPLSNAGASDVAKEVRKDATKREWDEAFARDFWPRYPRKVAKVAALRAWRKIDPKDEATRDRVVLGLIAHRDSEWRGRDGDKIPHAATWLNQRRWEDQDA